MGTTLVQLPDECRGRHGGNPESEAANERVHDYKAIMRERITVFVRACGPEGTTLKAIADLFGKHPNEISGRITELKTAQILFKSGRRADGCAVLVSRPEWRNGSAVASESGRLF